MTESLAYLLVKAGFYKEAIDHYIEVDSQWNLKYFIFLDYQIIGPQNDKKIRKR